MEEGKTEDQNQQDSDLFQVICWKTKAVLKEGQIFLLDTFPPRGQKSLSKEWG